VFVSRTTENNRRPEDIGQPRDRGRSQPTRGHVTTAPSFEHVSLRATTGPSTHRDRVPRSGHRYDPNSMSERFKPRSRRSEQYSALASSPKAHEE